MNSERMRVQENESEAEQKPPDRLNDGGGRERERVRSRKESREGSRVERRRENRGGNENGTGESAKAKESLAHISYPKGCSPLFSRLLGPV